MQEEEDYELRSVDRDDEMFEEEGDQDLIEEEIEEDNEYATDEEVDKRQYGIYQALPVDDAEPDWESGEAATVEEYLRRVRYEARQLPSTVTSNVDPRQFKTSQTLAPPGYPQLELETAMECSEELKPTLRWVKMFLRNFAALRHRLQREFEIEVGQVPGLPLKIPPSISSSFPMERNSEKIDSPSSLMPELAALKGLDQVTIISKLIKTIRAVVCSQNTDLNTAIAAEENVELPPAHLSEVAAEIYALSARVERPLHADTAAAYCALLRKCKIWRAQGIGSSIDPLLPHLNILICIAGGYFKQDEELSAVWDEEEEIEQGHGLNDIML